MSHDTLEARGLTKVYTSGLMNRRGVAAVDGVNLLIGKDERICLVGESGSGKTTLAQMMAGLLRPTAGEVLFDGKALSTLSTEETRNLRRNVQLISQYPDLALDPKWFIYDSIVEPIQLYHLAATRKEEMERVNRLCDTVELNLDHLRRKPRELSGGELQRVAIARSLALEPSFVLADEPTSMLDPSIQAKIVHILHRAQTELKFGCLFITHDLSLSRYVSDILLVMYWGRIIESGRTKEVLETPLHPFTSHMLSGDAEVQRNDDTSSCCPYYSYCSRRMEKCIRTPPEAFTHQNSHMVRCWLYE